MPAQGRTFGSVNVALTADDEHTLRLVARELDLPYDEVMRRALRLAGAMRALNAIHGVVANPADFTPEGVIW
jgi:hypothetical protein